MALAVGTWRSKQNIWIWDTVRETMTRLTFDEAGDTIPLWTPDGQGIVYSVEPGWELSINWKAADGSGEVEKLASWPNVPAPFAWSNDGRALLSWDLSFSPFKSSISIMPLEGDLQESCCYKENMNMAIRGFQLTGDGWRMHQMSLAGMRSTYVLTLK